MSDAAGHGNVTFLFRSGSRAKPSFEPTESHVVCRGGLCYRFISVGRALQRRRELDPAFSECRLFGVPNGFPNAYVRCVGRVPNDAIPLSCCPLPRMGILADMADHKGCY
ncbi:hypothetical protein PHSY_000798 [Pseudozyma hubeiensis SY62]|uniref:Uncharacterized protein n=1 Tax=Pseudozyma hubeiensis (strain SY62) TaxID=1305764 RepID=R9NXB4_PSEHS|nr:hypothetical protein PHSY_000798 [Pseudozyma hubeiensis SY62]GAC93234.1 hypothetical protein PHSY_000798 [Pseudozyma hubeiensis SY62]